MEADSIEQAKLAKMSARLKEQEAEARRNKLVLVQWSKLQYMVMRINTTVAGGHWIFRGEILCGPTRRKACEDFIREELGHPPA